MHDERRHHANAFRHGSPATAAALAHRLAVVHLAGRRGGAFCDSSQLGRAKAKRLETTQSSG